MRPHAISSTANSRIRILVLGLALSVLMVGCGDGNTSRDGTDAEVVSVKRGPLRIAVKEGGELASEAPVKIKSQVEGRNSIIELIDEGTFVKEGDLLCRLDSGGLEDNINRQQILVDGARSDLAQAEETLAIQIKLNAEELKDAESKKLLSQRALKGYVEGTLPLEEKKLRSELTVAKEELKRAETEESASQRLYKKEIIPKSELDADVLGKKKAVERVEIAEGNLKQFLEWTSKDEIKKLESDFDVKSIALTRVQQQCESSFKQKTDLVLTKKKNLDLEEEQFKKLTEQFALCEIRSPVDGLVVYARERKRHGQSEPISLGKEVYEREGLLEIPDLKNMIVELDIHESSVKKVQRGQRCWVKVDALPGEVFPATVMRVSLVPSSQSSWMNPDLKVYETEVKLGKTIDGMKPGMHAQVEILVDELENALQIPLQCVMQSGTRTFVYVKKDGDIELREIEVGLNNLISVHIKSGLEENELVFLTRPEEAPALPEPEKQEFMKAAKLPGGAAAGPGGGGRGPGRGRMDDGNMPRGGGSGRGGSMTQEQRDALRKRMESMSPEERKKLMEKYRSGGRDGERRGGERRGGERRGGEQRGGRSGGRSGGRRNGGGDGK